MMQRNTQRHKLSRRSFLQLSSAATAGAVLAACAPVGSDMAGGDMADDMPDQLEAEITVWHQDWDGMNRILAWATEAFAEVEPGVTVNTQPIGYGDLLAKLLPSIAAGNEGDINYHYTDWVVATDVSQVFLEITDLAGGRNALEERFFPAAFTAVNAPEGKAYYYPYISGLSDCVLVLNTDHFSEAGGDWTQWSDLGAVIDDCLKVRQIDDDGNMTHAAWTLTGMLGLFPQTLMYQLGGAPYDVETATFTYSSEAGIAALQFMHDIIYEHRLFDWDFIDNVWQDMANGILSMEGMGSWTYSVLANQFPLNLEAVPMPSHPDAVERILCPSHIGSWALSRRLRDDSDMLNASIAFIDMIMSTEGQLQAMEFYSGSLMSPAVYADPRIEDTKYGAVSKKCALGVWPHARYAGHHVANPAPAWREAERALTGEISIQEAVENIDAEMQGLEDTALERLNA